MRCRGRGLGAPANASTISRPAVAALAKAEQLADSGAAKADTAVKVRAAGVRTKVSYGTAYDETTTWLTATLVAGGGETCTSRSIYIAASTYFWAQVFDRSTESRRNIYLEAGTYGWADCSPQSSAAKPHICAGQVGPGHDL